MEQNRSGYSDDDIFRLVKDDAFVNQLSFTEKTDLMYDYCDAMERLYISENSYSVERILEIEQFRKNIHSSQIKYIQKLKNEIAQNQTQMVQISKRFTSSIFGIILLAFFSFVLFAVLFLVTFYILSLIF